MCLDFLLHIIICSAENFLLNFDQFSHVSLLLPVAAAAASLVVACPLPGLVVVITLALLLNMMLLAAPSGGCGSLYHKRNVATCVKMCSLPARKPFHVGQILGQVEFCFTNPPNL